MCTNQVTIRVVSNVETVEMEGEQFTVVRAVTDSDLSKRITVVVFWVGRLGLRTLIQSSLVSQVTNP